MAFNADENNQEIEIGCQEKNEIILYCNKLGTLNELSDRSITRGLKV